MEIPGTFKQFPEAKDSVTAKRPAAELDAAATRLQSATQATVDADKGALDRRAERALATKPSAAAPNKLGPASAAPSAPGKSAIVGSSSVNAAERAGIAGPQGSSANPAGVEEAERELQDFNATAYCIKGRTASGEQARAGIIAADPRVLPLGTVVHIHAGRYTGVYTVLDTGGKIKGRLVDVFFASYKDAREFGRRQVKLKVIGRVKRGTDPARKNSVIVGL